MSRLYPAVKSPHLEGKGGGGRGKGGGIEKGLVSALSLRLRTCVLVRYTLASLPEHEDGAFCVDSRKCLSVVRNAHYLLVLKG